MIDELFKRLGPSIERRHQWRDHRTHLGELRQRAEMTEVKRRLAHADDQPAAFLEGDIRSANEKVVVEGNLLLERLVAAKD